MIIGIEGQRLFRKKKHGMDMVALELIHNLQEIDTENQYYVFVKPDQDDACIKETPNFKIIKLKGGPYPFWEQFALPKAALSFGCELLHCTSNTAPIFTKIPLIVTLHDIIYLENNVLLKKSGTWYQKFGNLYRKLIVPEVVKKCSKIITVSQFERQRITDFFGFKNDNRLIAVYNGVGSHFQKIEDENILTVIKNKYHLPDKFFFHLGNTDPKKNTIGVLKAYSDFLKKSEQKIPLVMLDFDRNELGRMLREIGDEHLIENIQLTGYVANTDLPAVYSQCTLFLYPSLRESFGIPILEAMACGVPVITSNTSSMPEISGNAAFMVDPFKPETIVDAMLTLMKEDLKRNELIKNGFVQAAKFSWYAMAEKVLNIYKEVYSIKNK